MIPLIDQFPAGRLSREAEASLAALVASGSEAAQTELVLSVMRQALLYTRRVCNERISEQERASLCYVRLMRSAKRFDPSRGRFFAFSKAGLRGSLKSYWEDQKMVRNASEILSVDAMPTGLPSRGIPVPPEERYLVREQITGEIEHPDFDSIYGRDEWRALFSKASSRLNSQHRMVISLTYQGGLNGPEIGKLLGVSRCRVHAIHREAMKILRDTATRNTGLLGRE